jgi:hypothetical protein
VEAVGQARDIAGAVGRFEPQGRSPGSGGRSAGCSGRDDQVIGIGPVQKPRSRRDIGDRGGGGRGVEDGDGGQAAGRAPVRRGLGHQEEAGLPQKGRRVHAAGVGAPVSSGVVNGSIPISLRRPSSSRTSPVMTGETR